MTRPKHTGGNYDAHMAYFAEPFEFSEEKKKTIREICPDPEFLASLPRIAGKYQGY